MATISCLCLQLRHRPAVTGSSSSSSSLTSSSVMGVTATSIARREGFIFSSSALCFLVICDTDSSSSFILNLNIIQEVKDGYFLMSDLFLTSCIIILIIQMQILFDIAMAVCPVLGYILQYRLIHKNQSVGAFSIDICLVLLVANILRLNFYPFHRFETALIFQSLFMIMAQLILLHACSNFKQQTKSTASQEDQNSEIINEKFWRWSTFTPYWQSTLAFTILSASVTLIMWLLGVQIYGELVGLVALLTESLLILPQIIYIFKVKEVQGISYGLIFLNLLGDAFKTFYFFYNDQPFQFKLCGIIQLALDVFVISQICYFHARVSIQEIQQELQNNVAPKEKEMQTGQVSNNDDLQGSLTRTTVISEEQVENIESQQIKEESDTHLQ